MTTNNDANTIRNKSLAKQNDKQILNIIEAKFVKGWAPETIAKKIVIRTWDGGTSEDTERKTTKRERETMQRIATAAILAIADFANRHEAELKNTRETGEFITETREAIQAILDQAEYTMQLFFPEKEDGTRPNCYYSIYRPLADLFQITEAR